MMTVVKITSKKDTDLDKTAGFLSLLPLVLSHYFIWQLLVVAVLRMYGRSDWWATLIP